MVPNDCLYSKEHEWVRVEEDIAVIGITDFAQAELGDVVFVELPGVGDTFETGDEIGTIESVKAVAEIFTPVTGEILEINEALEETPEGINEDPYAEGWLVRVRVSDASELKDLMNPDEYEDFVNGDDE